MMAAIQVLLVNPLCPTVAMNRRGEKKYDGNYDDCLNCRACGRCIRRQQP
jgi:hypothetical protein